VTLCLTPAASHHNEALGIEFGSLYPALKRLAKWAEFVNAVSLVMGPNPDKV
jgi:hypothetical protein